MLSDTVTVQVRFSEVDSLRIVWHGNYMAYLEDAREAFGRKYGIGYMTIYENGYLAPMYDVRVRYHSPAKEDDVLAVRITWKNEPGAKLAFDYQVRNVSDGSLVLSASTIQLFTDLDGNLEVNEPDFYIKWKDKYKIISSLDD